MIIPCHKCESDKIVIEPAECEGRFTIKCETCGDTPHQPGAPDKPACFVSVDAAIAQWNLRAHGKLVRQLRNLENEVDKLKNFIYHVPHSKACRDTMAHGRECSCGKNLVLR